MYEIASKVTSLQDPAILALLLRSPDLLGLIGLGLAMALGSLIDMRSVCSAWLR